MKRLLPFVLLPIFLLAGCQKNNKNTSSFIEPHYEEVEELHIEWKDLLNQKEEQYFAYVYSVTCTPCSMLREEVINFATAANGGRNINTQTVPFSPAA